MRNAITSLAILFLINSSYAQDCGIERWDVKTLSDKDTLKIDFHKIIPSTVHQQVSLTKPQRQSSRLDSESTVYSIDCFIIGYARESNDKDIHMIIEDILTDETMVVEIPSKDCSAIQRTSRFQLFADLEEWFFKNIGLPTSSFFYLKKHIPVNITGLGFFDRNHGQIGMADNFREIHPVLSIKLKE